MTSLWLVGLMVLIVFNYHEAEAKPKKNMPSKYDLFWGLEKYQRSYKVPKLKFSYNSLSSYIDHYTMKIHHGGILKDHTKQLNDLLNRWRTSKNPAHKKSKILAHKSIIEMWRKVRSIPTAFRRQFMFYGGSYINHLIYFSTMSKNSRRKDRNPPKSLEKIINNSFRNVSEMKKKFNRTAHDLLGDGWVHLVRATGYKNGEYLTVMSTLSEMTAMENKNIFPILSVDVREHAYFKKYGHNKSRYIQNWWKTIDWDKVERLLNWWKKLSPPKKLLKVSKKKRGRGRN